MNFFFFFDKMQQRREKVAYRYTCPRRKAQKLSSNFKSMPSDAIKHSHIDFALLIYKKEKQWRTNDHPKLIDKTVLVFLDLMYPKKHGNI